MTETQTSRKKEDLNRIRLKMHTNYSRMLRVTGLDQSHRILAGVFRRNKFDLSRTVYLCDTRISGRPANQTTVDVLSWAE